MRRALISDIHGNLEALEAVLSDIQAQGITEIFCLGDIVGYGPNPRECIDRVMETCKVTLLGNHDQGAMFDPDGFNIGLNLGREAGAGYEEHLHFHIVPRWRGDTNFMATLADIRSIPEHIQQSYAKLHPYFRKESADEAL